MKNNKPKSVYILSLLLTCICIFLVHSCKRDQKISPLSPSISDAQKWYESTYPKIINNSSLITQGIGGNHDLTQITKPDWQHTTSYTRLSQKVIEMPFDPGAKLNLTLKTSIWTFNKAYSRSYYLLINDKAKYEAYILTIIADSDYVKNDLTKLTHNSYRKIDADFSGLILYHTPKGDYIGGYGYKDGHLVQPETSTTQSDGKKIQSVDRGALKPNTMVADCVDWYEQTTVYYEDGHSVTSDWVYLDTTCTYKDDGTSPGGGTTPPATPPTLPPPPPPCPAGTGTSSSCTPVNIDELKNNSVPPPTDPGDGGTPPPPTQKPCIVTRCPITDATVAHALPVADGKPAINPAKYVNCFTDGKTASGYKLTIYVNQPVPGHNDQWATDLALPPGIAFRTQDGQLLGVGHTFVKFEKDNTDGTSVKQVMGFYPDPNQMLGGVASKGVIKDDSNHPYNVSYTVNVSSAAFTAALNRMLQDNASSNYVLSNLVGSERNCTDAAISWMTVAGVNVPNAPRGSFSNSPGDFGQALAAKSGSSTVSGNAPVSHGPCN
jgi:hypothetical protein